MSLHIGPDRDQGRQNVGTEGRSHPEHGFLRLVAFGPFVLRGVELLFDRFQRGIRIRHRLHDAGDLPLDILNRRSKRLDLAFHLLTKLVMMILDLAQGGFQREKSIFYRSESISQVRIRGGFIGHAALQ
ncbi:Hypothetical protein GOX2424 [Gluconobacter oxydans 621H]|uniref:Uncharacterized protein n=1 Tax=Gluconobacter oxydans (strain 621H) TaxID=290633 RepID=Q5FN92_GLUOX|nr:Hypothetical protein GOX2424 [Gluconobacter oxydans 621H]